MFKCQIKMAWFKFFCKCVKWFFCCFRELSCKMWDLSLSFLSCLLDFYPTWLIFTPLQKSHKQNDRFKWGSKILTPSPQKVGLILKITVVKFYLFESVHWVFSTCVNFLYLTVNILFGCLKSSEITANLLFIWVFSTCVNFLYLTVNILFRCLKSSEITANLVFIFLLLTYLNACQILLRQVKISASTSTEGT